MKYEQIILTIITFSGEAKTEAMKAIKYAKQGEIKLARASVKLTEEKLIKAHEKQNELIQMEASGEKIEPTVLLIHGQDHLMTAKLMKEMAEEFIEIYERIS